MNVQKKVAKKNQNIKKAKKNQNMKRRACCVECLMGECFIVIAMKVLKRDEMKKKEGIRMD